MPQKSLHPSIKVYTHLSILFDNDHANQRHARSRRAQRQGPYCFQFLPVLEGQR